MTEMIHGLVLGLIWAGILGSCLIAIAIVAVITATVREPDLNLPPRSTTLCSRRVHWQGTMTKPRETRNRPGIARHYYS
jgi:hypothetical protein